MTDPIRWGICGTGAIAGRFVEAIAAVPDALVMAVGSNDPGRAARFSREHSIPASHDSYEALAADDDVDVVYVASTQERHHRDAVAFLDAGRHVLCEKPLALNGGQVERMIAAAEANDRFLMEAMWARFLPSYVRLRELIAAGTIGEPRLVQADFSVAVPVPRRPTHRLWDPERGGGALLDLGVYPVQLAHMILGPPLRVEAVARLTPGGIDEQTSMLFDHGDGRTSLLTTAMGLQGTNGARVAGTEGAVTLDPLMHCTPRLTVEHGEQREVLDFPAASLHFQVPEVHRCLRAGRRQSEIMSHDHSREIMATLDRVRSLTGIRYPGE